MLLLMDYETIPEERKYRKMEDSAKAHAKEFVSILQHIHTTIRKLLEAGNYPSVVLQLEQCQSYAISFGQQIEAEEGADLVAVALLEDYCELVYQIYETIRCFVPVDANDIHNALSAQLIRIRKSMESSN